MRAAAIVAACRVAPVVPWLNGLLGIVFAVCALRIVTADVAWRVVPHADLAALLAAGLASQVAGSSEPLASLLDAALRVAGLGLAAGLLAWTFENIRGHAGLGSGDVMLIAVAGAWLPVAAVLHAVTLAAVAALAATFALARWRGERPQRRAQVPFAAALAPAFYLAWLSDRLSGWPTG
jgi:prepilin signal peptidase PulO-like enzyme (type II secretory pathway)